MRRKVTAGFIVSILFLQCLYSASSATSSANQTVTFIDVGQGDSALIQDGAGFEVLIDGGKPDAGPRVLAYLRSLGINELEVMVATHADSDHIGGLISVLLANDIHISQVIYNGYPGDTATWNSFVAAVSGDGLTLEAAQFPHVFSWGTMQAHVLNPAPGLSNPEQNDASLVIRLDHGSINYLFTGDISSTVEAAVEARGTPVASEILKVAHHGSAYSTSSSFLAASDPQESIISVGVNSYGHPSPDTITRLLSSGSSILRTDQLGNISISSNGVTYAIGNTVAIPLQIYLPLIVNGHEVAPEPSPTVPAPTPNPTSLPNSLTGNIQITYIFFDGVVSSTEPDEFVQIENKDNKTIQMAGWTLRDIANHVYTFPSFVMTTGQVCRVYTNQSHPDFCGFNYGNGSAIWNNTGDTAYLRDSEGGLVSQYNYGP